MIGHRYTDKQDHIIQRNTKESLQNPDVDDDYVTSNSQTLPATAFNDIEGELDVHILLPFGKVVVEDGPLRSIALRQLTIDNNKSRL